MSEQLTMLTDQLGGLQERQKQLHATEKLFTKDQALQESIIRAEQEVRADEVELQTLKEELAEVLAAKTAAIRVTATALAESMGRWLAEGEAIFDIDEDGRVMIGLLKGDTVRHYNSLSGGERAMFNVALQNSLVADKRTALVILEAGEVDADNLQKWVDKIVNENPAAQVIINSWHPVKAPEDWVVKELK